MLNNLRDTLQNNRTSILPLAFIVLIGLGNMMLCSTSIIPQWKAYQDLSTQVKQGEDTLKTLSDNQGSSGDADALNGQIANAQATLDKASAIFFSARQADDLMGKLYGYAKESSVDITGLQAQKGTQPVSDLYDIRVFRLQVDGNFARLMNFVARIREATAPSFNIDNLKISRGESSDTLTMDVIAYVSPRAVSNLQLGDVPPATAILDTPTPTATVLDSWSLTGTAIWNATANPITPSATITDTPSPTPTGEQVTPPTAAPAATQAPQNGSANGSQNTTGGSQPQQPAPVYPTAQLQTVVVTQQVTVPVIVTATPKPATAVPTAKPATATYTPTFTDTPTATPTTTPTATPTSTDTPTSTPTFTDTPTATPTSTDTPTPSPTDTPVPTATPTDTPAGG
jgi:hypothetical protein